MLRLKLVKNGASGIGHISGVVVVACMIFGWSRPAFSGEPTAAPDEQPHLQLAPIRLSHSFGGDIGYIYQRTTLGTNKTMQQSLGVGVTAGVGVNSFIWQPWIAQVSSNLSAGVNSTRVNSNTTPTYKTVSTAISGNAALDLLSSSRFPFEANIFRIDNRYAAFYSGTNLDTQTTGYNLNQNYATWNQKLIANATFTSQKASGSNISPLYSDRFGSSLMMQLTQHQSISITGNTDNENQPGQGRGYLRDTLLVNHNYQPNSSFSLASHVDLFKMDSSLTQGNSPTQYGADSQQFSSIAYLRPERSPLTMTGSVRLFRSDSSSNGILTPTLTSSNFNLGANYLFSPMIRMYGSVNVFDTLGIQTVTSAAVLAAAKPFRTTTATDIGGFRYSGSIGGSLSTNNKTSTDSANQTINQNSLGLGLYLSHALDKDSELGAGHLSKNLNQTISMVASDRGSSISNLGSGGSLSWNRAEGKETTILRLSATDSRCLRGTQCVFQMINLQASRVEALSRMESLRGNLTVQATHTQASGQNTPNTITPSAEMSYRNKRLFKVRQLTFDSILRIADTNIAPTHSAAYLDRGTRSWDNNLAYKVGRLNLLLNTHISKIGNTLFSSILFSMNRQF